MGFYIEDQQYCFYITNFFKFIYLTLLDCVRLKVFDLNEFSHTTNILIKNGKPFAWSHDPN